MKTPVAACLGPAGNPSPCWSASCSRLGRMAKARAIFRARRRSSPAPSTAAIQWAQYGGNEGLWRILRTLDRHSVPATIFCSGRCGEVYPEVIAAAAKAGHDIAGHGYTQDGLFCYMTPDEERTAIRKTLDALEQASGIRAK